MLSEGQLQPANRANSANHIWDSSQLSANSSQPSSQQRLIAES